ncbi:glutaredoxin family protein [Brachybacterium sp. JB7]|nr:glutaredoxin family protein [Brachybacterium sp. JB7]
MLYLTRDGCHLCEDALPVVRAEADRAGTAVEVVDIDADEQLRADWDYDVPVIIVDGAVHARYRVEAEQLRAALRKRPWWRRLTGRA